jgi:hypothetical protein
MAWPNNPRPAKSLATLKKQIDSAAPKRSKVSDGMLGDTAHSSRKSDHNPNSKGVVCALDITNDPGRNCDAASIAGTLRASADKRIGYIIWNKQIWNPVVGPNWRAYKGANPHTKHVHISVKQEAALYDNPREWTVSVKPSSPLAPEAPRPATKPTIKQDSKSTAAVRDLQALLGVEIDGKFGPKTKQALISYQKATGLVPDGMAGPYTWEALLAKGPSTAPIAPPVASLESEPRWAINFLESLGWPKLVATALVAHLMWESGGNSKNTIIWAAHGDKGRDGKFHSHGAPQWNDRHGRYQSYLEFALKRGTDWANRESQLRYLDHELRTTEKSVAARLKKASTLEEAVRIGVDFWRPSKPHLDKRLAVAKSLDK